MLISSWGGAGLLCDPNCQGVVWWRPYRHLLGSQSSCREFHCSWYTEHIDKKQAGIYLTCSDLDHQEQPLEYSVSFRDESGHNLKFGLLLWWHFHLVECNLHTEVYLTNSRGRQYAHRGYVQELEVGFAVTDRHQLYLIEIKKGHPHVLLEFSVLSWHMCVNPSSYETVWYIITEPKAINPHSQNLQKTQVVQTQLFGEHRSTLL